MERPDENENLIKEENLNPGTSGYALKVEKTPEIAPVIAPVVAPEKKLELPKEVTKDESNSVRDWLAEFIHDRQQMKEAEYDQDAFEYFTDPDLKAKAIVKQHTTPEGNVKGKTSLGIISNVFKKSSQVKCP